ncbi:helix-turn-helix transcriptional regulator [Salinarimonas soli]|nr:helix-turn-helix transcriptional regulator [Salinarimonas soli]
MAKITPAQCRAARGLLDWTQEHLAERAELSRSTIRDFEGGRHDLQRASAAQLVRVFDASGVALLEAGDMGPGVRLKAPPTAE